MEKTYKISEIAKMFDITRTALIHYDKWGILSPSIRNENNYRFYTTEDIKRLELIIALKESGLSLEDIKAYLDKKINKSSKELLIHQKEEIDKKIETLRKQSLVIQKRIKHLSKFNNINIYEGILLEEHPEMVIAYESIGFGPLMSYSSAVSKLKKTLDKDDQLTSKYGICFDINHKDSSGKYLKKYVFDYLSDEKNTSNLNKIPKYKYLKIIHEGRHFSVEDSINKILEYANEKDYQIIGEAYYVPLFDYWESMYDEFIGEVLVPVIID